MWKAMQPAPTFTKHNQQSPVHIHVRNYAAADCGVSAGVLLYSFSQLSLCALCVSLYVLSHMQISTPTLLQTMFALDES